MNGLESEYANTQIEFVRLDANSQEGGTIQRGYGLRGHPSIAIVDASGEAVQKYVGAQSAEILRPAIDSVLNSGQ